MRISDWSSDVCSSDLTSSTPVKTKGATRPALRRETLPLGSMWKSPKPVWQLARASGTISSSASISRSEEHTSELQSLMRISYAVFCLKKKNYKNEKTTTKTTQQTTNSTNHIITTLTKTKST